MLQTTGMSNHVCLCFEFSHSLKSPNQSSPWVPLPLFLQQQLLCLLHILLFLWLQYERDSFTMVPSTAATQPYEQHHKGQPLFHELLFLSIFSPIFPMFVSFPSMFVSHRSSVCFTFSGDTLLQPADGPRVKDSVQMCILRDMIFCLPFLFLFCFSFVVLLSQCCRRCDNTKVPMIQCGVYA